MILRISFSIDGTFRGNSCANEDPEVKLFKPINKSASIIQESIVTA